MSSFNPFASKSAPTLKYLTAKEAQDIDAELMGDDGAFSIDQARTALLMELAGLSVAQACSSILPLGPKLPLDENGIKQKRVNERVLVCCGPGNQGGDGLVAARHLHHFGYAVSVFYPKEQNKDLLVRLKKQCENLELPFIAPPPAAHSSFPMAPDAQINAFRRALKTTDWVLDCVFGFSFKGPARPPYDKALVDLKNTDKPIVSVDIPSGWDVEQGNVDGEYFTPAALISLTAPKKGVEAFARSGGMHWLGGRFIPPEMDAKFGLNLPEYPGSAQAVDITKSEKL
ncbi:hypothetical protein MNV49_005023 [Pseudohyphozyma bogoriensis]|nr:hypothetical protein MNV49_005023 [Pseudohyphozyma bogoriensis]